MLPASSATNFEELQRRHIYRCSFALQAARTLTFPRFRGRILFCHPQGQIARTISEDRVNRRRILAGILSVGLLGFLALFLPSLHKTPEPASSLGQPLGQSPSETVNSHT